MLRCREVDAEYTLYPTRLLLVVHHLVVDLMSWQVLLADLEMLGFHLLLARCIDEMSLPALVQWPHAKAAVAPRAGRGKRSTVVRGQPIIPGDAVLISELLASPCTTDWMLEKALAS